ncbi:MAG TPA: metallophosphoesterase family protein [Desulfobacteraceae bacterium]|nr:metallophosphoesterase family protein [Desulfobacteraceae bacterium]
MRLAVISDVHSNLEAFSAVLASIQQRGVDAVISLGDNIGYGGDPEAVTMLLRRNLIVSVMGNHELALLNEDYLAGFNSMAKAALVKNRALLSHDSLEHLSCLKSAIGRFNGCFVHGIPPDSITTYLSHATDSLLERRMAGLSRKISFVGHTHLLGMVELGRRGIVRRKLKQGGEPLDPESRYIINAGSVGQPRDGDPRATFVIWDADALTVEPVFIEYDRVAAAEKIRMAGIPEVFARRLL